jgi:hypothetical protein
LALSIALHCTTTTTAVLFLGFDMVVLSFLTLLFSLFNLVHGSVTVYSQAPLGASATATGSAASYTGAAAYDPTVLTAPAVPNPLPPMQFTLPLQPSAAAVTNLSIQQSGSFFGFSIEMSVINQVCEYFLCSCSFSSFNLITPS